MSDLLSAVAIANPPFYTTERCAQLWRAKAFDDACWQVSGWDVPGVSAGGPSSQPTVLRKSLTSSLPCTLLGFASNPEWFPGWAPVGSQATTSPSAHPYLAVFKWALTGICNSSPTFRALLTPILPNPDSGSFRWCSCSSAPSCLLCAEGSSCLSPPSSSLPQASSICQHTQPEAAETPEQEPGWQQLAGGAAPLWVCSLPCPSAGRSPPCRLRTASSSARCWLLTPAGPWTAARCSPAATAAPSPTSSRWMNWEKQDTMRWFHLVSLRAVVLYLPANSPTVVCSH